MSEDKLSRRDFLQVAGAAGAVGAAAGCSPTPAVQKLYPYLTPPEEIIPGTPVFYRTVCRGCAAGCGITAKTREGRVIKLEGNPDDPIGRGALCARGQATLQELYAPDRITGPMAKNAQGGWAPISWDDALARVAQALAKEREKGGRSSGIRFLTRPEPGSAGALQRAFLASFQADVSQRVVLEPFDASALRAASQLLYDRPEIPVFDLAQARTVVSFGADFLETWLSPVELTRAFTEGRGRVGPERTRLTWVGPRLSATAGSADTWMKARPGSERVVALGILRWLLDPVNQVTDLQGDVAALRPLVAAFTPELVERQAAVPSAELARLGRELAQRRPSALLGPGPSSAGADAVELAVAIALTNAVLGNVGRTVQYGLDPREDTPSTYASMQALVADMEASRVEVLFIHHADPVGSLPGALGARSALAKVPFIVSFSDRYDATTQQAHLILPDHHPLESFGDVSVRKGVVALCQPVMTPLANTRQASQVLLDLGQKMALPSLKFPFQDFFEYTQTRAETYAMVERGAVGDLIAHQRAALMRGGYYSAAAAEPASLSIEGLKEFAPTAKSVAEGLTLVTFPTALRGDGHLAHLPWLREVPDVTSTVAWSTWVELSPSAAKRLEVETGDVVAVTTPTGSAELTAYVYPGLRDDTVALPLGSPEVLGVLPSVLDSAGGLAWTGHTVDVKATGRQRVLPLLSTTPEPHAGEIIKHVNEESPAVAPVPNPPGMYPEPEHPKHRWAMTIDLDRCTGCQACVVACYAENNIPVMGPEFTAQGRNMSWLRIERYFDEPADGVDFLPMMCQQCSNAPCESVCPVYATYHTAEGLNAQVYNRCVGTRYCSNNCPYKVRIFNYADPQFASPLDFQLNPDVTVRSKGVMEKCTFCVQRVRHVENTAKSENRSIKDGELAPACAQTCPGQAIVFGDTNDPTSRVNLLRKGPRGFKALEELNTAPAVTYLARVKGGKP